MIEHLLYVHVIVVEMLQLCSAQRITKPFITPYFAVALSQSQGHPNFLHTLALLHSSNLSPIFLMFSLSEIWVKSIAHFQLVWVVKGYEVEFHNKKRPSYFLQTDYLFRASIEKIIITNRLWGVSIT